MCPDLTISLSPLTHGRLVDVAAEMGVSPEIAVVRWLARRLTPLEPLLAEMKTLANAAWSMKIPPPTVAEKTMLKQEIVRLGLGDPEVLELWGRFLPAGKTKNWDRTNPWHAFRKTLPDLVSRGGGQTRRGERPDAAPIGRATAGRPDADEIAAAQTGDVEF